MSLHATVAGWLLGPPSGANRRLLALLAHLGPQLAPGERVTVLHRPDYAPPTLPNIAWHPIAIPNAPSFCRAFAERRLLPRVLRELGATVHDHGFLPLPRLPVPTVLLVHDVRAADGLSRWPRSFARMLLRRSCERATTIVVPSRWTAGRVRTFAPRAPEPVVIGNGVETPLTSAPALARPLPANGYVLHTGHIEPRKNLDVVVGALARLPAATRPELWLAGHDAGALANLRQQARANGVALVAFGIVPDDVLHALYAQARTVVVPSVYEGFGLPALEAIAHARPLLVADAGALPEVAGPCARVLPPHDPAAWAAALATVTQSPDAAANAAWLRGFQWDDSARRLLQAWRRLGG